MTYCRNAMRLPIGISPLATRRLPNHRIATVDRLKTAISSGIISANSRLTLSDVAVRSRLATSKRSSSCRVRTKARMTRTPLRASRVTWLTRSILTWIRLEQRQRARHQDPTMRVMIGRITIRMPDSGMSWRRAMMTPPIARIGRDDHHVQAHQDDHLDLLDVVRVAGDERRRAEAVELGLREALDLAEDRAADVATERHAGLRAPVDGDDRAHHDDERDAEHHGAGREDVGGVALGHAVVDDVGVELGQVERRERLDRRAADDEGQGAAVRAEVGPQEGDHARPPGAATRCGGGGAGTRRVRRGSSTGQGRRIASSRRPDNSSSERAAGLGQGALDDAPVVRPMVPRRPGRGARPAATKPVDGRRAEVEHLGDPAHRLRPFAQEQEQQADLAERQVARRLSAARLAGSRGGSPPRGPWRRRRAPRPSLILQSRVDSTRRCEVSLWSERASRRGHPDHHVATTDPVAGPVRSSTIGPMTAGSAVVPSAQGIRRHPAALALGLFAGFEALHVAIAWDGAHLIRAVAPAIPDVWIGPAVWGLYAIVVALVAHRARVVAVRRAVADGSARLPGLARLPAGDGSRSSCCSASTSSPARWSRSSSWGHR